MIGAIQWYHFYAGTPSSLFVRHSLSSVRFLFCITKILCSTLCGEKPIGVEGSKIGLSVCPMIGAIQYGTSFMLAPPLVWGHGAPPKFPLTSNNFFSPFSLRFRTPGTFLEKKISRYSEKKQNFN